MKSLLEGVAYIHEKNIIHRDLKPENILIESEDPKCSQVKIIDFGLSYELQHDKREDEKAGTLIYMAPEQVTKKGYQKKIDMWACGIVMYQLLEMGKHPFYEKGEKDFGAKLMNIETKPIKWKFGSKFSELAKDFFLKLCAYPYTIRYDANEALQHPWITRNADDKIPLTQTDEILLFESERVMRKVIRSAFFTSLLKFDHFRGLK